LWKVDIISHPEESHGHNIDLDFYDEYFFVNTLRNFNELIE